MAAIRIADWRATRLRDTSTGPVNHAEPATPCGIDCVATETDAA
jgi:hypothetical protein